MEVATYKTRRKFLAALAPVIVTEEKRPWCVRRPTGLTGDSARRLPCEHPDAVDTSSSRALATLNRDHRQWVWARNPHLVGARQN